MHYITKLVKQTLKPLAFGKPELHGVGVASLWQGGLRSEYVAGSVDGQTTPYRGLAKEFLVGT